MTTELVDALITVLLAGISESIGQSVVLFANRVTPARFVLSLITNALLVALGFAILVLCTWATFFIPGTRHVALATLTVAIALSYAPLVLSFLAALPYAGNAVMWALRVGQVISMVTGVAEAEHVSLWLSAAHVAGGYAVVFGSRQAFGKQLDRLQSLIAKAVAGKAIVREHVAVERVIRQLLNGSMAADPGNHPAANPKRRKGIPIFTGVIVTFIAVVTILVALTPLRISIAHEYSGFLFLRVGFDIVWIAIAAVVIAALLAPIETLGWWAGWYGDNVNSDHPSAKVPAGVTPPGAPGASAPIAAREPSRYIVYLDGISQSSAQYAPDVETFLDALEKELPPEMLLIRGIMAYSVVNRPLDDDPMYARFWKWVEWLRGGAKTAIMGMFINIRNVMIVGVSADARYGPLYNLGIAQVVYNQLIARGYRTKSGIPITLIGYSGGGQMCAETGPLLKRALGAPINVISLAGVMTGTCPYLHLDHLHHMFGSKDVIEPLGPIMFSSRWKIMTHSNWNRALRRSKITVLHLGPVGHQVPGGLLDPAVTLADGRSALRQTLDHIGEIIRSA